MASFLKNIAEQIVVEIEKIIGRHVNIMDEDGQIIASTDASRVGSFHEGAVTVLREGKPVRIYSEQSHRGAKQGVNMPFYYKEELHGVIGITGDPSEVGNYAKIIQKMTEVMVKEAYVSRELELEQRFQELFVHEWLLKQWSSTDDFVIRGKTLSINLEANRQVLMFEVRELRDKPMSQTFRQEKINAVMGKVGEMLDIKENDLLVLWQSHQFVLLKSMQEDSLPLQANQIQRVLETYNDHALTVQCGIGRSHNGLLGAVESFEDARQALIFAQKKKEAAVSFYDLGIESLVHKIPDALKEDFIERLFPIFNEQEHQQLLETLRAFLDQGQSIYKTSESLFIHKNTLQYRLLKIKKLTGYDPRTFQDAVLYWLAFNFYDHLKDQQDLKEEQ